PSVQPSSASARVTSSACMRSVIAIGVCMAGPPWPKASRSWAAVSIFASMLVTSTSNRCSPWLEYCASGSGSRRNGSLSTVAWVRSPLCEPRVGGGVMRYKCWRSRNDTHLHVLCAYGSEAFESLPVAVRNLGPWTGGPEGEIDKLRLPDRVLLNEQKFVVIHGHVSELQLETVSKVHALPPANTDWPQCNGKGEVPQHGGLRQKTCTRCNGRGWIKTPSR